MLPGKACQVVGRDTPAPTLLAYVSGNRALNVGVVANAR